MSSSTKRKPTGKKQKAPTQRVNGQYQAWTTEEGLLRIEGWCRDGLTDIDIAHNIGINPGTLYKWKKAHPEIAAVMKTGKEVADRRVENALYKRAIGFEFNEVKTVQRIVNGKIVADADVTTTKKYVPGDVTAQIIWLKHRKKEWREADAGGRAGSGDIEDLTPLADLLRGDDDGS